MPIKPKSAKQKGKNFERQIAKAISKAFNYEKTRRTPMSGALPDWKGDIACLPPEIEDLCIECKCQETMKFWQWMAQAERESGSRTPVLMFTRNRSPVYVTMEFNDWLNLILEARRDK